MISGFIGGKVDLLVQRFVDAGCASIISYIPCLYGGGGGGLLQVIIVLGLSSGNPQFKDNQRCDHRY